MTTDNNKAVGKQPSLHVGVGRANNAGNVGNANNVYGVAASSIVLFRPTVFADDNQHGRISPLPALDEQSSGAEQTELERLIIDERNIARAANIVIGYVDPMKHLDKLTPRKRDWVDHREEREADLRRRLAAGYRFSIYSAMRVYEPKMRDIHFHEDWVDNIAETAVINVLAPIFHTRFGPHTYGSIKGRGTLKMLRRLEAAVRSHPDAYYLQVDVRKFYESLDPDLLLSMMGEVVRDAWAMDFLTRLVRSYAGPGVPIGIPMSQFSANLYLSGIDDWLAADARVIDFARNMDDIGIIVADKQVAHAVRRELEERMAAVKLTIKPNWRIAPLTCGMDILGYVIYPTHTRLRRRNKDSMKRRDKQLRRGRVPDAVYKQQMASYYGWCIHGNCRHLLKKVFKSQLKLFKKMNYKRLSDIRQTPYFGLDPARRVSIKDLGGIEILFLEFAEVKYQEVEKVAIKFAYYRDLAELDHEPTPDDFARLAHYTITRSEVVKDRLRRDREHLPFVAHFVTDGKYIYYE
jgi:hypothetical protein